jgi:putative SOS response-associated peptidase YedK
MCGRFTLVTPVDTLVEDFKISKAPKIGPRYNIAPTQDAPAVVMAKAQGEREFRLMRWGLVPGWAKDPAIGSRMINARAETISEKPSFRTALKKRRCLILADGFYEWIKEGKSKQPHHIRMANGKPFAMAGLWERWEKEGFAPIDSCVIITTEANEMMAPLHHRMPVILEPEDYETWLDPDNQDVERILPMLKQYPSEKMEAIRVSKKVNNPTNDTAECLEPEA